jgi:hypothetical protein
VRGILGLIRDRGICFLSIIDQLHCSSNQNDTPCSTCI